ncbi:hypothetical protein [Pseudarthrobacter sp. BIM B-2242]|uniref:hypothetical protein n=1 Tax=Pseudarthrobacter sp. BIM B-2242 TaxID=2772401 RepID=UPI00168ADB35|nr:hypothetical protein [Pseudarthrobacter sp. BIM B-2242]QOD05817.1 hypothetical protein IDT60_22750 [Pseudarthrobacter sp. BIM B-2242]
MQTSTKAGVAGTLGVLAILGLPLLDPLTRARFINDWVIIWGFPLLLIVIIGVAVLAALAMKKTGATILIGILGIGGLIFYANARDYNTKLEYASTVHISNDPMPGLKERAPFLVAERQASSNLSGINGQIGGTDYLADSNHYSTIVDRKGNFNPGYAAIINQTIQLTGQASGKPCLFDEKNAHRRMDGWFHNSLTRAIAAKDSLLIAKKDDAWGYCDGDTPKIVVPVTKLNGWINPVHRPAGVAIYDGRTGNVEIRDEVRAGDLPGPAVALSYVQRVNDSLATHNGGWWSMVQGQSGLTDEVKDANDPNQGNHSAFSLAYKDAPGSVYASPFTSRASSRSIEDVALLESGHVKAGESPSVTLYHLEVPRQSNAATADKIKADYSSLNGWATGLSVQEVIPVSHDEWAASIGLNQNVVYRVQVKADGSSCLANADGEKIRCIDKDGKSAGTDGTQTTGSSDAGETPTGPAAEIGTLSNEDLAKLQDAVTQEVLKRLSAAKQ